MTVTIHFLTSESNIRSLLNFGCFSSEITNCLHYVQTFSGIFFGTLSNYGTAQEQSFKGERLITIY